jgi:hypothetical protein
MASKKPVEKSEKQILITQEAQGGKFKVEFIGSWQAKEIPRIQNAIIKAYKFSKVQARRLNAQVDKVLSVEEA